MWEYLNLIVLGTKRCVDNQMQIKERSLMCTLSVFYSKHLNSPYFFDSRESDKEFSD